MANHNNMKSRIQTEAKSRLCIGDHETMHHIINGGNKIAQIDYKLCDGKTTTAIHWHMYKKHNLQISQMWYNRKIKAAVENRIFKYTLITI